MPALQVLRTRTATGGSAAELSAWATIETRCLTLSFCFRLFLPSWPLQNPFSSFSYPTTSINNPSQILSPFNHSVAWFVVVAALHTANNSGFPPATDTRTYNSPKSTFCFDSSGFDDPDNAPDSNNAIRASDLVPAHHCLLLAGKDTRRRDHRDHRDPQVRLRFGPRQPV